MTPELPEWPAREPEKARHHADVPGEAAIDESLAGVRSVPGGQNDPPASKPNEN